MNAMNAMSTLNIMDADPGSEMNQIFQGWDGELKRRLKEDKNLKHLMHGIQSRRDGHVRSKQSMASCDFHIEMVRNPDLTSPHRSTFLLRAFHSRVVPGRGFRTVTLSLVFAPVDKRVRAATMRLRDHDATQLPNSVIRPLR